MCENSGSGWPTAMPPSYETTASNGTRRDRRSDERLTDLRGRRGREAGNGAPVTAIRHGGVVDRRVGRSKGPCHIKKALLDRSVGADAPGGYRAPAASSSAIVRTWSRRDPGPFVMNIENFLCKGD